MERNLEGRCGTCGFFVALRSDEAGVREGECRLGCWPAPLKDTATCSTYKAVGTSWDGALKRKPVAGAPRRYADRDEPEVPTVRIPEEIGIDMNQDEFRQVLRQVLREELGVSHVRMGDRWIGGELVLKPGKSDTQEKRVPLDQFFHKIVMMRDKLRVLEQKINGHDGLSAQDKVQLQQYVTGCYGTLTTFNLLFADRDEAFAGAASKD